ncbi:unnamed protein product, partial [Discosporangium mesarthrocarpum]
TLFDEYPILVQDKKGVDVPVVTTSGEYFYIGVLDICFTDDGEVTQTMSNC